jgi:DNA transformation protein
MSDNLATLRNLGPKSQQMLERAGLRTLDDVRQLGTVAAFLRVKAADAGATLNLLWALEGALSGRHWRDVAREDRTRLLLELDSHQQGNSRA